MILDETQMHALSAPHWARAPRSTSTLRRAKEACRWLAALLLCVWVAPVAKAQSDCAADGDIAYICGLQNAEDLIPVAGSDWVLAGQLVARSAGVGGFYLISTSNRSVRELAPDFSHPKDPLYSECPGPPDPARFAAHGLAVRYRPDGRPQIYAINHGGREAVEVFDLHLEDRPRLLWRGCVVLPDDVAGNAVAPLPDGFAVTSFGVRGDRESFNRLARGEQAGFVAEWSSTSGWSRRTNNEFAGANGIAASDDGRLLFVAGWGDGTLNVLSREPGAASYSRRVIDLGGFRPDNVRFAPDGAILVAGQAANPADVLSCAMSASPSCLLGYRVMRVDPIGYRTSAMLDRSASPSFGGASTAIMVGDEIWLGTFRGDRVARIRHPAGGSTGVAPVGGRNRR